MKRILLISLVLSLLLSSCAAERESSSAAPETAKPEKTTEQETQTVPEPSSEVPEQTVSSDSCGLYIRDGYVADRYGKRVGICGIDAEGNIVLCASKLPGSLEELVFMPGVIDLRGIISFDYTQETGRLQLTQQLIEQYGIREGSILVPDRLPPTYWSTFWVEWISSYPMVARMMPADEAGIVEPVLTDAGYAQVYQYCSDSLYKLLRLASLDENCVIREEILSADGYERRIYLDENGLEYTMTEYLKPERTQSMIRAAKAFLKEWKKVGTDRILVPAAYTKEWKASDAPRPDYPGNENILHLEEAVHINSMDECWRNGRLLLDSDLAEEYRIVPGKVLSVGIEYPEPEEAICLLEPGIKNMPLVTEVSQPDADGRVTVRITDSGWNPWYRPWYEWY